MLEVLMQILVAIVIVAFPLAAIAANFMRHRLETPAEGRRPSSGYYGLDRSDSPMLTPTSELSKRAA